MMNMQLPGSIATFFEVSNGTDSALLIQCFAADATVRDEGNTHEGHEAIHIWQRDAQREYQYTVEPENIIQQGATVTVTANVTGNFPGRKIQLTYIFQLTGDKIQSLEIH